MAPARIRTKPVAEGVYEAIVDRMVSGELIPGQPIPIATLADGLNVSRTPVREAIQRLAHEGLLDHDINQKPVIRDFSGADVAEIFSMRVLLEGETAYEAATTLDRLKIDELFEIGNEIADAPEINEAVHRRWADYDDYFHDVISRSSQNSRLVADIARHRLSHRILNLKILEPAGVKIAVQEHLAILRALKDRDGDEARRRMRHHIREWRAYFVRNYQ